VGSDPFTRFSHVKGSDPVTTSWTCIVAIADMFLKVQGVTGDAGDTEHKGEIDILTWSWGMEAQRQPLTGQAKGRATIDELHVVKRVDQSSPTLMSYLRQNKVIPQVSLTVRKVMKQYFKDLDGEKASGIYDMVVAAVEKPMLEVVMFQAQGNQTRAAELLGLNRNTLRKKLKQHGFE